MKKLKQRFVKWLLDGQYGFEFHMVGNSLGDNSSFNCPFHIDTLYLNGNLVKGAKITIEINEDVRPDNAKV